MPEKNMLKDEKPAEEALQEEAQVSEKAEAKKKMAAKQFFSHPAFISIVSIAIIALGVLFILSMNFPPSLTVFDFEHASIEKLPGPKIIHLVSSECPGCEIDSSFIKILSENGLIPVGQKIDVNSKEGEIYVKTFGIKIVPVIILDERSLNDSMQIKIGNSFVTLKKVLEDNFRVEKISKTGDFYFIPEDDRTIMRLDTNSCGTKDKAQVDLFSDPYCAPCALTSLNFNTVAEKFGPSLDVNYNFYPVDSKKMLFKWEQVSPFANYSICSARQGKLLEFQASAYAYYCNPDQNIYDLNSLQNCEKSRAFRLPLPEDRLLIAFKFAGLDSQEFGKCLEQIETEKPQMITTARYFGVYEVPKVVVNCKYVAHAEYVSDAICAANPALQGCKK